MRIFIGYDHVESVAYHTLVQSIMNHASGPVSITPIKKSMLPMYNRMRDERQSNEFTYTRFLVPYLCDYEGWALFMDCDMMFRADPYELWNLRDDTKSIQVCKHDYTPTTRTKFLGTIQYAYPRKNWSSVMLFNCAKCKELTPDIVNSAEPKYLHRMEWTKDENIGELSLDWNHLVGEYAENPNAKIVHWTIGGPYFNKYRDVEFAEEWRNVRADTTNCMQLTEEKIA